MTIFVCPLSKVTNLVDRHRPARIISLLDPDRIFPDFGPAYQGRHLRLAFHDVHDRGADKTPPSAQHIEQILRFLAQGATGESVLVHCRAGIGRSTATAFVVACWKNPDTDETVIAKALRSAAPLARPNETLVQLADFAMGRDARMSNAIRETGRDLPWIDVAEGVPFELPAEFVRCEES